MRFVADENFPRPALEALREAFRRGLSAGSGVVLFRLIPESPEEAADVALALVKSQPDLNGTFCVITRDRIRVRPMHPAPEH